MGHGWILAGDWQEIDWRLAEMERQEAPPTSPVRDFGPFFSTTTVRPDIIKVVVTSDRECFGKWKYTLFTFKERLET